MYKYKCELCGKHVYRNRKREHINICQIPSVHVFCGKECKNQWIKEVLAGRIKVTKIEIATA